MELAQLDADRTAELVLTLEGGADATLATCTPLEEARNGYFGIFFDVFAHPDGPGAMVRGVVTGSKLIDQRQSATLHVRDGTGRGFEEDPEGWRRVGGGDYTGRSELSLFALEGAGVAVPPGETAGFHLHSEANGGKVSYGDWSRDMMRPERDLRYGATQHGDGAEWREHALSHFVIASDAVLELRAGAASIRQTPFERISASAEGRAAQVRVLAGSVCYDVGAGLGVALPAAEDAGCGAAAASAVAPLPPPAAAAAPAVSATAASEAADGSSSSSSSSSSDDDDDDDDDEAAAAATAAATRMAIA